MGWDCKEARKGGGGEGGREELEAWGRLIDVGVQAEILKSTHSRGFTW